MDLKNIKEYNRTHDKKRSNLQNKIKKNKESEKSNNDHGGHRGIKNFESKIEDNAKNINSSNSNSMVNENKDGIINNFANNKNSDPTLDNQIKTEKIEILNQTIHNNFASSNIYMKNMNNISSTNKIDRNFQINNNHNINEFGYFNE